MSKTNDGIHAAYKHMHRHKHTQIHFTLTNTLGPRKEEFAPEEEWLRYTGDLCKSMNKIVLFSFYRCFIPLPRFTPRVRAHKCLASKCIVITFNLIVTTVC